MQIDMIFVLALGIRLVIINGRPIYLESNHTCDSPFPLIFYTTIIHWIPPLFNSLYKLIYQNNQSNLGCTCYTFPMVIQNSTRVFIFFSDYNMIMCMFYYASSIIQKLFLVCLISCLFAPNIMASIVRCFYSWLVGIPVLVHVYIYIYIYIFFFFPLCGR
jgi:hypothetical protein